MADPKLCARHSVTITDRAYKNSLREGVRVNERSKAKSSAPKMSPESWGMAPQMLERLDMAFADSMRAMIANGSLEVWRRRS